MVIAGNGARAGIKVIHCAANKVAFMEKKELAFRQICMPLNALYKVTALDKRDLSNRSHTLIRTSKQTYFTAL